MRTISARMPFDPNDPPTDAPMACYDHLLWNVSRALFADHQAGVDGFCQVCRPHAFHPCDVRRLADRGLRTSCLQPWRPLGVPPLDPVERQRWLATTPMIRPISPGPIEYVDDDPFSGGPFNGGSSPAGDDGSDGSDKRSD